MMKMKNTTKNYSLSSNSRIPISSMYSQSLLKNSPAHPPSATITTTSSPATNPDPQPITESIITIMNSNSAGSHVPKEPPKPPPSEEQKNHTTTTTTATTTNMPEQPQPLTTTTVVEPILLPNHFANHHHVDSCVNPAGVERLEVPGHHHHHHHQQSNNSSGDKKITALTAWKRATAAVVASNSSSNGPSRSKRRGGGGAEMSVGPEASSTSSTGHGLGARKFRALAQGLAVMNRMKAGDSALQREQNAFMSKYGMSMAAASEGAALDPELEALWRRSKWEYMGKKFVADPSRDYYYAWLGVLSLAYVYNLFAIIYRCVFLYPHRYAAAAVGKGDHSGSSSSSINSISTMGGATWGASVDAIQNIHWLWTLAFIVCDVVADLIYAADAWIRSRTGYFEQGLLVRDLAKLRRAYWRSWRRNWDAASVIPLDYAVELWLREAFPLARFNRLAKVDRLAAFITATETRISAPNAFRVACVLFYILVLIHWNACIYFLASALIGLGTDSWVYGELNKQSLPHGAGDDTLGRRYLYCFYWSTLQLTTIGEVPGPVRTTEFLFVTAEIMCGVLIFATIVGNVGSMIAAMGEARSEFQRSVDTIRRYMKLRGISRRVSARVFTWFDYLWAQRQVSGGGGGGGVAQQSDQQVLGVLPTKLQAEIAMHVHFETLRKVRIFQDCESGLLAELVLKLQPQTFAPNDYVCRKGDIGREMYIVKRGRLQVVSDNGARVFHTLHEGAVFGELSVLNIAGNKQGNRRSANIRSLGYTDLFVLKKSDLWEALREYPAAQKVLIHKGRELLRKDDLLEEDAPEVQKTQEELANELQALLEKLEMRVAKLIAEHTSMESALKGRILHLENELALLEDDTTLKDDAKDDE